MPDELDLVPWASLPQPEWNAPDAVPRALRRLAAADSERESDVAYTEFLFAVGNDHAGTYFPVAVAAVPFLRPVLEGGREWAKRTALEVLIDLTVSFEPQFAHDDAVGARRRPDSERAELAARLAEVAGRLMDAVRALTTDSACSGETRKAAAELLARLSPAAGAPSTPQRDAL